MKKKALFSVVFILLLPYAAYCSGYILATYGTGGDIDDSSVGIEMGAIFLSDLHPTGGALSFGLGVSLANSDENPPSLAYPNSTNKAIWSKDYNDGDEEEVYLSAGAEIVPSLFLVIGGGYATQDIVTIMADSTGQMYKISDTTEHHGSAMLQIRYAIEGFTFGLGYHSRRGIIAGAGIAF